MGPLKNQKKLLPLQKLMVCSCFIYCQGLYVNALFVAKICLPISLALEHVFWYYQSNVCSSSQGGCFVLSGCTQRDARLWSFLEIFLFLAVSVNSVSDESECMHNPLAWFVLSLNILSCIFNQEFEENGDPENHFQALLSLAKEGIEKGKVQHFSL